mmetsp:Transcript_18915/g.57146  ORF Transcript_18915/g.57146 Transcript_18915/m.57146 type:complete len:215 (-) Transcript_18915:698-1342(-)
MVNVPLDGHVVQRKQAAEHYAVCLSQLRPVGFFQRGLRWRQELAIGVVHKVQLQPAALNPVPRRIQQLQSLDAAFKDTAPTLLVHVGCTVARQASCDPHSVGCQKLHKVLLPRLQQHRQVAAVNDVSNACVPSPLHHISELVRQLRRAAGDVQGVHGAAARPGAAALEQLQASVRRGPIHGLRAQWRRLHVAVTARLVAIQPNIQLQNAGGPSH